MSVDQVGSREAKGGLERRLGLQRRDGDGEGRREEDRFDLYDRVALHRDGEDHRQGQAEIKAGRQVAWLERSVTNGPAVSFSHDVKYLPDFEKSQKRRGRVDSSY